uniref:Rhodanese domain-containing protein n=1 Tax=Brassica campestris TaxID=3711 RepID=A0A3P6BB22_BRACM|nr:unnamed protein product [Brassica rapa]
MVPSKPEEVVTVDVSQAKTLLQSDHQYLDVRTEEEFRRGHCVAPKILNVPYMLSTPQGRVKNPNFLDQVSSLLSPTDDILVGCQSGARSLNATSELVAAVRLQESEKHRRWVLGLGGSELSHQQGAAAICKLIILFY